MNNLSGNHVGDITRCKRSFMEIVEISVLIFLVVTFSSTAIATECGTKRSSRIVGGRDSGGYHYPWFALLVLKENEDVPICAGTLITSVHVLTAAHCFNIKPSTPNENLYNVVMGVYDRCNRNEPNRQIFTVSQVFVHEEYDRKKKFHDVALMTLGRPATDFTVACLPSPGGGEVTEPAVLIGFGVTKEGGRKAPCHLMEARVTKYSKKDCKRSDLPEEDIEEKTVICAGRIGGGIDSCQGDSGGPLQTVTRTGQYVVSGIVSYGYGCGNPGLPGLYTDVASYLAWINDKISGDKSQSPRIFSRTESANKRGGSQVTFPERGTMTVPDGEEHFSGGIVRFPGQNSTGSEYLKTFEEPTGKISIVSFPSNR